MMTPEHPRKVSAVGKNHQVWLGLTFVRLVRFVANFVKCLALLDCETDEVKGGFSGKKRGMLIGPRAASQFGRVDFVWS